MCSLDARLAEDCPTASWNHATSTIYKKTSESQPGRIAKSPGAGSILHSSILGQRVPPRFLADLKGCRMRAPVQWPSLYNPRPEILLVQAGGHRTSKTQNSTSVYSTVVSSSQIAASIIRGSGQVCSYITRRNSSGSCENGRKVSLG
jgi:hypothetical protein